jgi:hypothetical protein
MKNPIAMRLLYLALLLTATGCDNDAAAPIPADFEGKKLVANYEHPDHLLTTGAIAAITGQKNEGISVRLHSTSIPASGIMATYSWPTTATETVRDIKGQQIAIPVYASLAVGMIQPEQPESFRKRHNSSTGIQLEADALATDSAITTDISLRELHALETYAKTRVMKELPQVGDIAYWEMPAQALHVLADGCSFTIVVNTEDNEAANQRIAIKTAAQIMATKLD